MSPDPPPDLPSDGPAGPPDRDRAAASLERELSRLFGRARSLSLTLAAQIHPDLDSASYVLLQQLSDLGPARAADVVERTGLDKSTVSRQIARLEELALVERVADPSDGRARLVALTESGATRLSRVRADRGGLLRARIADWPTTDIHEFTRLLNRLNSDL